MSRVASSAALIGMPTRAVYSAAKTAVLGLTRSVALEYAKQGVRVNAIAPGAILTPLIQARLDENPQIMEQVPAGADRRPRCSPRRGRDPQSGRFSGSL
ncbi:SDR family oxidoreductase [Rathayibacter sp. VKM Ac-2857]|uniref:SDR family oxidoreductase n=1 Tax=Rathayibacter sp. VKM Ac-2857 TaxID=2739020 RepID=UPI001563DC6F|nr:SDR family oxidoreductase [Rathayibacter sp. VKM Ac-2857]